MPNKKYKIAVIQLNLNDIAENNLKNASVVCDAAKLGAEGFRYQNYTAVIILSAKM
jgi:hypothetical protein